MSKNAKRLLKQGLVTLPLVALLSGCIDGLPDGAGGNALADTGTVEVSGGAVKGVIQQGIVKAHRLVLNEQGVYVPDTSISQTVRTNANGGFKLKLKGGAKGWALVELAADASTTMKCDVMPGCAVGSRMVPFGDAFALDSGFTLRGAVDLSRGEVFLTPLSHLAVSLAEQNKGGLTHESIAAAYDDVEQMFGLTTGSLQMAPPDLTNLGTGSTLTENQLQLAIVNASFLAVVNDNAEWTAITEVLEDMSGQITKPVGLSGQRNDLWVGELIGTAADQSTQVRTKYSGSEALAGKFDKVAEHNNDYFDAILAADGISGDIDFDQRLVDTVTPPKGLNGRKPNKVVAEVPQEVVTEVPEVITEAPKSDDSVTGDDSNAAPEIAANAAFLSWGAPMQREDGTSLYPGDIAGYELRYGRTAEELGQFVETVEGTVTSKLISGLEAGTWMFEIRTIDTDENVSRWSASVSKTVNI